MDLDYFKLINDVYGYVFGDLVFKCVVVVCYDYLCKSDIFGCFGGEEFGILLLGCMLVSVVECVEVICVIIVEMLDDEDMCGVVILVSFGVVFIEYVGYDL